MVKLSDLKLNPKNPRIIKEKRFKKLKQSVEEFPKMLELRPIIVDENNVIVGGNMRYKALVELGYDEVDDKWVRSANDFSPEELRRFVITDNVEFGEPDFDMLANDYDLEELLNYGMDQNDFKIDDDEFKIDEKPEVKFSEELKEEHNFVVLYFDNEIDWLNLQSLYPLETVQAVNSRPEYYKAGIGRVIRGVDFIEKVRES